MDVLLSIRVCKNCWAIYGLTGVYFSWFLSSICYLGIAEESKISLNSNFEFNEQSRIVSANYIAIYLIFSWWLLNYLLDSKIAKIMTMMLAQSIINVLDSIKFFTCWIENIKSNCCKSWYYSLESEALQSKMTFKKNLSWEILSDLKYYL